MAKKSRGSDRGILTTSAIKHNRLTF